MEKAVQAGSRCISLEVRPSNLAARLWEVLLPGGRVRKKYYDDEDGLIMFRELNSKEKAALDRKRVLILGLETSCDETAAAVVESGSRI